MPNWKKVIVSGSNAHLSSITSSLFHTNPGENDLVFDAAGDIIFDADGADVILKDGGTEFGRFKRDSSDFVIKSATNDKDIVFRGEDGGSTITAMTIDMSAAGRVGIGTTSPLAILDIRGANSVNPANGTGGNHTLQVNDTTGMASGVGGGIAFGGKFHTNGTNTLFGEVRGIKENGTNNNYASALTFTTRANGGNITEKMRISSTGNVNITGNISGSSVSSSGDILADGDVVAYNSSDERLKDNIEVIQGSLDKIGEIRGVEFDWNDKSPGWARERGHDVGVIAQEVQKVIPEIVVERKNGYLGVDYKRIVPLLIESIKELKQEVEILKKKVN